MMIFGIPVPRITLVREILVDNIYMSYRESNPGLSGPSNEILKADDVNPYTIPEEMTIKIWRINYVYITI